uniref:Putative salivary secreted protein n=1 Tax=Ornithodoros turicata TaxID=34597 RepID=A0A2R5LAD3_9ACAR
MEFLLVFVAAFIAACDAYNFAPLDVKPCVSGGEFAEIATPYREAGKECKAGAGSRFQLRFTGMNHERYPLYLWADVRIINHPGDSFVYSSNCQSEWTNYPCVAQPGRNVTGYVAIKIPSSFKKVGR